MEKSRAIHAHDAAGITAGERSIELAYPGKPHIIHETDRYIYVVGAVAFPRQQPR